MTHKTDYQKGLTAGLALLKRMPKQYRNYRHSYRNEIAGLLRTAEEKYSATLGSLQCPFTGEPSYMRSGWYREGMRHAIEYGQAARYILVKYNGNGTYTMADCAEDHGGIIPVYSDPCYAWQRSWQLDPAGHQFKSIDVLYVNGAVKALGLGDVYGI